MTLLGALVVLLHLRRRNLDFLVYIHTLGLHTYIPPFRLSSAIFRHFSIVSS